jgi:uncharacterized NAD(P)/FAD-binding protein YdhS
MHVHKGRVKAITEAEGTAAVTIGLVDGDHQIGGVGLVFNCTGANGENLGESNNALLRSLHAASLIQPDPLGLGIHCDDEGAVLIDGATSADPWLFAMGPALVIALLNTLHDV